MLLRRTNTLFYRKKLGFLWGDVCFVPVRQNWIAVPMETVDLIPSCVDRLIQKSAELGIKSIIFESHADYGLREIQDLPERPTNLKPNPHEPNQMLEFRIDGAVRMADSEKATIWELFSICNGLIVADTEQIVFLVTHDDITLVLGQKEIVEDICELSVEQGLSWLAEFAEYTGDGKLLSSLARNLPRYPRGFSDDYVNLCEGER